MASNRASPPPVPLTFRYVRPTDQVDVRIELVNLVVDRGSGALLPINPAEPSSITLDLGSQHTVEATYDPDDRPATVGQRSAGPSRIVLDGSPGPFTVDHLLDLAARTQAKPRAGGDTTRLEVPEGLVVAPDVGDRFRASTAPVVHLDVAEVWTAALGDGGRQPTLRAIANLAGDDFDRPLPSDDRANLVSATAGAGDPIDVQQLLLSSHGAFARLRGAWETGDLASYWHHVVAGRDVHVEAVERGYLAPFGHRATMATVSRRVVAPDDQGKPIATVVTRQFLAVAEPTVQNPATFTPHDGRGLPFTTVTVVDPDHQPIEAIPVPLDSGGVMNPRRAFVIGDPATGGDRPLAYRAVDRGGAEVTFSLPAIFVVDSSAYHVQDEVGGRNTPLGNLAAFYRGADDGHDGRRIIDLDGQAVTWAEPDGPAGSTLATTSIRVELGRPDLSAWTGTLAEARAELAANGHPAFGAVAASAEVIDEVTAGLYGDPGSPEPAPTPVTPSEAWLASGLDRAANPDGSYLTVAVDAVVPASFERSGTGVLDPSLTVDTFSQELGAGAALTDTGSWDPAAALGTTAKFLGVVAISELIDLIDVTVDGIEGEGLPTFEIYEVPGAGPLDLPEAVCTEMDWQPAISSWPEKQPILLTADLLDDYGDDEPTETRIFLKTCVPFDGSGPPTTEIDLMIDRVGIQLPPVRPGVRFVFDRLRYHSDADGEVVTSRLADWEFIDYLAWLEPVRRFILEVLELGEVEISSEGLFVDFDIPVPQLSFGVIGVSDLDVAIALDLPSSGASEVHFGLSERTDPFSIVLFGFGGTGSFELRMVADAIILLEGSLGVTYELSANAIVARASLSATLGAWVTVEPNDQDEPEIEVGAYVELAGSASVLGLVEVSGRVTLSLIYNLATEILRGVAEITGEVDSIFGGGETSFEAEVEVALGDGAGTARELLLATSLLRAEPDGGAPTFADRFDSDEWNHYCDAFAEV